MCEKCYLLFTFNTKLVEGEFVRYKDIFANFGFGNVSKCHVIELLNQRVHILMMRLIFIVIIYTYRCIQQTIKNENLELFVRVLQPGT